MHKHMSFKDVPITTISPDKSKPKWFADPDARHLGQIESDYQKKGTTSPPSKIFKDRKECVRIKAVPELHIILYGLEVVGCEEPMPWREMRTGKYLAPSFLSFISSPTIRTM